MAVLITPKEAVAPMAYKVSAETAADLWELADILGDQPHGGWTVNQKLYKDAAVEGGTKLLAAVTIRPTLLPPTAMNTFTADNNDHIIWDGLNIVVKTDEDFEAQYVKEPAPVDEPASDEEPTDTDAES